MDLFGLVLSGFIAVQQVIGVLVGIVLLLLGGALLYDNSRFNRKAYKVSATVVGLREDGSGGQPLYYPVVEYTARDGRTVRAECDTGSSAYINKVPGTRLRILVDPDKPERFRLPGKIGLVFGLIFAGFGFGVCYFCLTAFPFSFMTPIVALLFIVHGVLKIKKFIKPREERETLAAFKERTGKSFKARREAMPILDRDDVRHVQKKQDDLFRRTAWIGIIVAGGLIWGGYYVYQDMNKIIDGGVPAAGRVVSMESVSGTDHNITYRAVVRFADRQNVMHSFRDKSSSNPPMNKVGDAVRVLYREERPEQAMIDRGAWNWAVPGGMMAAGALVFFATVAHYFAVSRRSTRL